MNCPLCSHDKPHKHGKTSKGSQSYFCPKCQQTFTNTFDPLYYRRQVSEKDVRIVLQAHAEGSSLRGISRISGARLRHSCQYRSFLGSKSADGTQCPSTRCRSGCYCCG